MAANHYQSLNEPSHRLASELLAESTSRDMWIYDKQQNHCQLIPPNYYHTTKLFAPVATNAPNCHNTNIIANSRHTDGRTDRHTLVKPTTTTTLNKCTTNKLKNIRDSLVVATVSLPNLLTASKEFAEPLGWWFPNLYGFLIKSLKPVSPCCFCYLGKPITTLFQGRRQWYPLVFEIYISSRWQWKKEYWKGGLIYNSCCFLWQGWQGNWQTHQPTPLRL